MKPLYKVYIADDHTLFRKAMVNLLRTFERVSEVKDAENGKELLALIKYEAPDVVIVDLQMPVMDGAETSEQIIQKFPEIKIIILTMHDSNKFILHMMEMGVHAFLLKNTEPDELEKAIYSVVEKDFYHNDLVASVLRKNVKDRKTGQRPVFQQAELTDREKEILLLICRELTMKEIGQRLFLSENTVRNHRVNIMDKVGVNNIVGLVKYAYETGLIT
ncbi:two component transcriptional regulator, LuxR family [Chryseolinea serpens]|uniref:Two component transcriptional regulator, LuxR family n=1 Tax=Chryseolinea serpens TaxID=947013 RepID=A0A1M5XFG5_9BACT|nr:response regulator transcription factor [Chryseolinea serpens]SHH98254.1 two component transcriptional regulator, LuxR family [Chryseolinea serpens]